MDDNWKSYGATIVRVDHSKMMVTVKHENGTYDTVSSEYILPPLECQQQDDLLPPNWLQIRFGGAGDVSYFNTKTKERQWNKYAVPNRHAHRMLECCLVALLVAVQPFVGLLSSQCTSCTLASHQLYCSTVRTVGAALVSSMH